MARRTPTEWDALFEAHAQSTDSISKFLGSTVLPQSILALSVRNGYQQSKILPPLSKSANGMRHPVNQLPKSQFI